MIVYIHCKQWPGEQRPENPLIEAVNETIARNYAASKTRIVAAGHRWAIILPAWKPRPFTLTRVS